MNFEKLFRKHILELKPYTSARDEYSGTEGIFLDANENPLGSVIIGDFNRYPDPYQYQLKEAIGAVHGLEIENIFLGNGSDEAIDLIIQATCNPNEDEMIILPPTYGMYQVCADIHQVKIVRVPLDSSFLIQEDQLRAAIHSKTKIIWFCSPNNPSGNLLQKEVILSIAKDFPDVLVIIDEAYIDFAKGASLVDKIHELENIFILQTFSKAWGMAGLRIGMAFGHPFVIKMLSKLKYPYNLNLGTQRLAWEAMQMPKRKIKFVEQILQNKQELIDQLQTLALVVHIYPSDSNQLLVKFVDSNGVFESLLSQKIIVRDRSKNLNCENCLRISVGTKEENKALIEALKKTELSLQASR